MNYRELIIRLKSLSDKNLDKEAIVKIYDDAFYPLANVIDMSPYNRVSREFIPEKHVIACFDEVNCEVSTYRQLIENIESYGDEILDSAVKISYSNLGNIYVANVNKVEEIEEPSEVFNPYLEINKSSIVRYRG